VTHEQSAPEIVVLGGGIGGLAATAFLRAAGLRCTLYEQAHEFSEVGAGLVVAPNAARLLRRLGVLHDLTQRAVQLEVGWEFRRWQDGTILSAENLTAACEQLYGEHTYTAHRADLVEALRSAVPTDAIRFGKKCTRVDLQDQHPVLHFTDGDTVHPDVLVGADGIHSVVRGALFGAPRPTYSGLCAFRALVPADKAPPLARRNAQTLWIGPDHHLVHYPISAGTLINLVAFAPAGEEAVESWTATASVDEFLAEFTGWDPQLRDLIHAAGTPGRWALLSRAPLPRWSVGPVTLLGDAAHPMFPFFAQGAAQAIEDAAVLAQCLAADVTNPTAALQRYDTRRITRTTRLQHVSHDRAHINHLPDGPEQQARDTAFADRDPLRDNAWIYGYDPGAIPARS
jgi:salicylate hydroxylase